MKNARDTSIKQKSYSIKTLRFILNVDKNLFLPIFHVLRKCQTLNILDLPTPIPNNQKKKITESTHEKFTI